MAVEDFQLGDGETHAGKANMRLIRRAIKNRWPIPEELRAKVVEQMGLIVEMGDSDRDKVAAAKVLVAADSLNLKSEELETPQQHEHLHVVAAADDQRSRLAGIAERLGVDLAISENAEGTPSGHAASDGPSPGKTEVPGKPS